jgi:leucyl aminopeptidase
MTDAAARVTRAVPAFDPLPSRRPEATPTFAVATEAPSDATAIGIPVAADGAVPRERGALDRATLEASGFGAAVGEALLLPRADGPTVVEIGVGARAALDMAAIRDAAAAFAHAAAKHARLAVDLTGVVSELEAEIAGQAVVEGVLLARYRYRAFVAKASDVPVAALTLVTTPERVAAMTAGMERGAVLARAVATTRDLCNTPGTHLTARRMAEVATEIAAETGLGIEVLDEVQLVEMGCGGLLGVNAGSGEPARLIKLSYRPDGAATGHLGLVGKGIMYDAGGISLKPSDAMHAAMKLDMSGAAAILGAMSTLRDLGCPVAVTGWLMCTDNMPSGTATRLGDVLTIRGGKTVEVVNADAEGRLVMADGLVLAVEEGVDAIVTIATLTGAALRTFGPAYAALLGTSPDLVGQVRAAGAATDEPAWELPLVRRYRRQLDSAIADIKNMGGVNAGTITAGLFLADFVDTTPFAHVDMCGPMMAEADDGWRPTGATAYGTRLLAELAVAFRPPAG